MKMKRINIIARVHLLNKSIHLPKTSKRKTESVKIKDEDNEFTPIGRSKTIANRQKTHEEAWHEENINKDLFKIDLDQINTSISTLFLTTLELSDNLVKNMILGLGELVVNNIEELSTQATSSRDKSIQLPVNAQKGRRSNLFWLRKITEIAVVNTYRIEQFWQIILDQLMVISVWNNEDFRSLALESFMIIILEILMKKELRPSAASTKNKVEPSSKIQPKIKIEETKIVEDNLWSSESIDWEEKLTAKNKILQSKMTINTNFEPEIVDQSSIKLQFPNEEIITWNDERWQIKVLKPFCDCISSTLYEKDQIQVMHHLKSIIEKAYARINKEGWRTILSSLCNLNLSKFSTEVFVLCYELIQIIVFEHIDLIRNLNVQIILENIKHFSFYHQGIFDYNKIESNSEMWWSSSRIFVRVAKYLESMAENSDNQESNLSWHDNDEIEIVELWNILFNELKVIYIEAQYSNVIRRSTLQALDQIMNHYSSLMAWEQWEYALQNTILNIFEKSVNRYIDQLGGFSTTKAREIKQREAVPAMQTPTFSFGGGNPSGGKKINRKGEGRKMRFDEESIQKFHQRNIQESSSQNEFVGFGFSNNEDPSKVSKQSTLNIEDQNLSLTWMRLFSLSLDNFNKTFTSSGSRTEKVILDLWISYSKHLSPFINNSSVEVLKGVLETINFILDSSLSEYFYQKYENVSLGIFEDINNVIQRKTDLILTSETSDLIVKIFKKIFTKKNIESKPQILNLQNINVVLHILRVILMNIRPTTGFNVMRQDSDLNDDEK